MTENIYKEAFDEAMLSLENEYKKAGNEDVFQVWFKSNFEYVEDTIDSVTLSEKNIFVEKIANKKGYTKQIQDKISNLVGQNIKIITVIRNNDLETSDSDSSSNSSNSESFEKSENSGENSFTKNFEKTADSENKGDYRKVLPVITPIEDSDSSDNDSDENEKTNNFINNNPGFKKHPLLKPNFVFETFIPGENSELPYKASLAVANNPGKTYNPLMIYGGSGLGKTHLMQAIGNYIHNHDENLKIYYGTAESFATEFSNALRENKVSSFANKFRNLDVLLLDDIHFLDGKKGYQEQLFYTFEALHQKNAQMVFTCDRPLSEIKSMTERLVTRLSNGMYIDITIPNYETRVAILNKKVEEMGKFLEPEIVDYIAKNIETNVRELESALNKVFGYAELMSKNPTIEICKNILKDIITPQNNDFVTIDIIQKVVADHYEISVADLKSPRKDKKFSLPRQIAYYLSRELLDLTYKEIGNNFGGKDHSTIMYACTKIDNDIKLDDSKLIEKINTLKKEIREYNKEN